ncbi:hypothetical protein CEP53_001466 [Fusarium sp. AF-6]|nr:hypothetical protein CEP53_001466 [Fusarium sp. AF-6]
MKCLPLKPLSSMTQAVRSRGLPATDGRAIRLQEAHVKTSYGQRAKKKIHKVNVKSKSLIVAGFEPTTCGVLEDVPL